MPKNNEIDKVIGSNLRRIRLLRNRTQNQLAKDLQITFQQIQKYETGKNRISASVMYLLAQALETEILDFFIGLPNVDADRPLILSNDHKLLIECFDNFSQSKQKSLIHFLAEK